jgi:hypothetical protein
MTLYRFAITRSRLLFASLPIFAVIAYAAVTTAPAGAQTVPDPNYWKSTSENRSTVYRLIYDSSPQAVPAEYDPVREAEEILRQRQAGLPASNPESPSIWRQIRTVSIRSALSSPLRVLGTVALGFQSFELGWKIGTGVNAKFLRIGIPKATSGSVTPSGQQIAPRVQGSPIFGGLTMPYDGWLFTYLSPVSFNTISWWFGGPGQDCPGSTFYGPPPSGFTDFTNGTTTQCVTAETHQTVTRVLHAGVMRENDLSAVAPIEPYSTQSYSRSTPAPTQPPRSSVEQGIETALGDPDNGILRDWLNYQLGSPGAEDPTEIGAQNPDIEFPGYVEHWEEHGDEFVGTDGTPLYDDPYEYWRDAADIVSGQPTNPDTLRCTRASDGAVLYWDSAKGAIIIVKDGKIVTYFRPDTGFDYWLNECNS